MAPRGGVEEGRAVQESQEPGEELSAREREAIELVAGGLTNKEVAAKMGVSISTVKGYMVDIFRKAGVNNRTSAALWWKEHKDKGTG
jgi:DNA-binding NarL/FixJ family response regulator